MSYLCVSYAEHDTDIAMRFCHELTKYGFRYESISEATPQNSREALLDGCATLLLLSSPHAEKVSVLASDLRYMGSKDRPALCISLSPNQLDQRFCLPSTVGREGSMVAIPYPAGETDTPDARSVALFVHRLYMLRLCKLSGVFTPSRCVDDPYGRTISTAVKAWAGDAQAQYEVGLAYASGSGVPVLETETALWMKKAAQGGLPDALIRMGELLLDGEGVERDPAEALRLFSKAANEGDPRGQYYKGICCLYGYGLMKDPEMAVRYLHAATDMGYAPALYRLGLLYRDGIGTKANWHKAVSCLYLAACPKRDVPLYGQKFKPSTQGSDAPRRRRFVCVSMRYLRSKLAQMVATRSDATPQDIKAVSGFASRFCRPSRISYPEDAWLYDLDASYDSSRYNKNRGYSHQKWDTALACGALGRLLELGSPDDHVKPAPIAAFLWYRRAMKQGHSGAMFRLGDAYRKGRGVPRCPAQGVRLFRRAAEFGNVRGQFAMGVCCEGGQGLPKSLTEAVRWYEMAAEAGYAPAQNNLGGCYEYGLGVPVDMLTAVEWYTKASAQGQPDAACRLGLCYESGRGVPQSDERAFRLFEDASRKGHAYALYRLGLCYDLGVTTAPQVAYAAHLYERAARGGVGEAAYAMALCCENGRGVRKNPQESFQWLQSAADLGSVQGCFELGLCYFEGSTAVQNKTLAMTYFRKAVSLYHAMSQKAIADTDRRLPVDCMTSQTAAGGALYMLGYGTLTGEQPNPQTALSYFEAAAAMDRYEAMTAMGDLYTYGLLDTGNTRQNQATARTYYETAAKGGQVDALLALAVMYEKKAIQSDAMGDVTTADSYRESAWRSLAKCAEQGSIYALVGMAGCAWFGHGTTQNKETAKWFLTRANRRIETSHRDTDTSSLLSHATDTPHDNAQGGILPSLWLGDIYFHQLLTTTSTLDAETLVGLAKEAYTLSTTAPLSLFERGPYALPARVEARRQTEIKAKAEAHYHLAMLEMMYATTPQDEAEALYHLGEAVLSGHEAATCDLARMYAHWKENIPTQASDTPKKASKKKSKGKPVPTEAQQKPLEHLGGAYYVTNTPKIQPFSLTPPTHEPSPHAPAYATVEVTPIMIGNALNHLGDRYFYGEGLPEDKAAAVSCYRRAAEVQLPRNAPPEGGIIWAQYSLGYCLLWGIGTKKNPRSAVSWLTRAAKYHGDAAYCLGLCYEDGTGVDSQDIREALKFYRRALKLGCTHASPKILGLEKRLCEEA